LAETATEHEHRNGSQGKFVMRIVKHAVRSLFKVTGYEVIRVRATQSGKMGVWGQFPEMEAWERAVVDTISPYTLTSVERQWALISALKYVHLKGIAGDIVECGVYRGGNLILAGLVNQKLGSRRQIWGYDTYEGMSEPSEFDIGTSSGIPATKKFAEEQRDGHNAWCYAPLEEVSSNIERCGLDLSDFRFIKGKCEETLTQAKNLPDKIAILRLDTDWYASTRKELEVLFPLLAQHGVLIVDDYGNWAGAQKAVDEYFRDQPVLMNRIDYTARLILKV
jgi:hypothetical protein